MNGVRRAAIQDDVVQRKKAIRDVEVAAGVNVDGGVVDPFIVIGARELGPADIHRARDQNAGRITEVVILDRKRRRRGDIERAGVGNHLPLLDEHIPEWGKGGIGTYFYWKRAHRKAWNSASRDVVLFRLTRAERLGLTYEEYTLEILERGRYLQVADAERIREIKRARSRR